MTEKSLALSNDGLRKLYDFLQNNHPNVDASLNNVLEFLEIEPVKGLMIKFDLNPIDLVLTNDDSVWDSFLKNVTIKYNDFMEYVDEHAVIELLLEEMADDYPDILDNPYDPILDFVDINKYLDNYMVSWYARAVEYDPNFSDEELRDYLIDFIEEYLSDKFYVIDYKGQIIFFVNY